MTMNSKKTKRIYECEHYKYEYDDFGKYAWCLSRECLSRECFIEYKFCHDLCPFYKKNAEGRYIDIELDDHYKKIREMCCEELKKKAEEAVEEAAQAMRIAQQKMEYAKRFN